MIFFLKVAQIKKNMVLDKGTFEFWPINSPIFTFSSKRGGKLKNCRESVMHSSFNTQRFFTNTALLG